MRYRIIEGFLSPEECRYIIELAKPKLAPSAGWNVQEGRDEITDYRLSNQMFFTLGENPLIKRIEKRIESLTKIPTKNGEGFQVVHYSKGGYYKSHTDYFDPEWIGNKKILENVGQRIMTVLIYLKKVEMGGQTYFPLMKLSINPEIGKAVVWSNVDTRGKVDETSEHFAETVKEGEKWIMTKWLHKNRYR